jgi:lysophospholipase L1-like esterase
MIKSINTFLAIILNLIIFSFLEMSAQSQTRELKPEEIKSVATGCYSVYQTEGYYHFHRFPAEALEVFKTVPAWILRAQSTSGIRIRFRTDSRRISLAGNIGENTPQTEPFIILCNDSVISELPERGVSGSFERDFLFPDGGERTFEICFPAYSIGTIRNIQIDKDASLVPVKRRGVMFAMGNSITQTGGRYKGYTDIVARGLDLDLHEAGVGGHIFEAESLPFAYVENPALITVAYGTNDWNGGRPVENARIFLEKLTLLYPEAPVILLEPIRRYKPVDDKGKLAKNKEGEEINEYRRKLRKIVKDFDSVKVIAYKKLMPGNPELFSDGVHPTEEGHAIFGNNLLQIIKKHKEN